MNVVSAVMMDKENINNMQVVDTQKNQLIEENAEDEPIAYFKNNENTKTIEFVTESHNSLKDNEKNENYTVNDLDQKFDYKNREIIANKNTINKKNIQRLIRQLLIELGENPDREGLVSIPRRIVEMYNEIFAGYGSHSELEVSFTEEQI